MKPTSIKPNQSIEFTDQFQRALHYLEHTDHNIFITGKAGTGKSTLLKYFRQKTNKNIVVLAPTGVSAINVQGQTIHSFFGFKPDITVDAVEQIRVSKAKRKMYQSIDMIVIDEISMVRADLLDCVNQFLSIYGPGIDMPFGGVQVVVIGDLFQLPPVVTRQDRELFRDVYPSPYFFDAISFKSLRMKIFELTRIFRQSEEEFIRLLGAIRDKSISNEDLALLNKRYQPDMKMYQDKFYVYLTTTNIKADEINKEQLALLKTRPYHFEGDMEGDFDMKSLPTQISLDIKFGAQVMLLNNDPMGRWVNGSIGKVSSVRQDENAVDVICVELADGRRVDIAPFTWEMFRFFYDEDMGAIDAHHVGSFIQYPIKLAWAVTIHKSQGKTYENVILDIGTGAFAHGQTYVALSRCKTLNGLVLRKPILKKDIIMDWRVVRFMSKYQDSKETLVMEPVVNS